MTHDVFRPLSRTELKQNLVAGCGGVCEFRASRSGKHNKMQSQSPSQGAKILLIEDDGETCAEIRDANLQLLDALGRLEALDRRFQIRSGTVADRNGSTASLRK